MPKDKGYKSPGRPSKADKRAGRKRLAAKAKRR